MSKVGKKNANHIVAKVSGVKETDSRIEAARKAIAVMEMAGMPTTKAKKMLNDAIARGVR